MPKTHHQFQNRLHAKVLELYFSEEEFNGEMETLNIIQTKITQTLHVGRRGRQKGSSIFDPSTPVDNERSAFGAAGHASLGSGNEYHAAAWE